MGSSCRFPLRSHDETCLALLVKRVVGRHLGASGERADPGGAGEQEGARDCQNGCGHHFLRRRYASGDAGDAKREAWIERLRREKERGCSAAGAADGHDIAMEQTYESAVDSTKGDGDVAAVVGADSAVAVDVEPERAYFPQSQYAFLPLGDLSPSLPFLHAIC